MAFTDRQVNSLRPRRSRYEIPEPGRTGLALRVSPFNVKTWCFRYRFHGVQKRMLLGTYPQRSLVDARLALADAKKKLDAGDDPGALMAEARRATRTAATVAELVQEYLTRHTRTMRPATIREDTRILDREILPHWRHRKAATIDRRDVMTLLNGIEDRGVGVMRNRIASVLSRLFLFGLNQGLVPASPAVTLPRLTRIGDRTIEQPRTRVLSQEEIRDFWQNLDKVPLTPAMRLALRWLLVTGQRRSDVAGAPRLEIDDKHRLWRIPGVRTKNKREQILPLPSLALDILKDADRMRIRPQPTRLNRKDRRPYDPTPSPWLFPSTRHAHPITPAALTCALVRHRAALGIGTASLHDLRRSFATHLGELGTPPDILSALLGHAPTTITKQVYDHSKLIEAKRKTMEKWSAWLSRVIAGKQTQGDVVRLRG